MVFSYSPLYSFSLSHTQKYNHEESQEQLDNAIALCDLGEKGEHCFESDSTKWDEDANNSAEEEEAEEAHEATEEEEEADDNFDPEKVMKILQPIIKKRVEYIAQNETVWKRTIEERDRKVQEMKSAKSIQQCNKEETKIAGNVLVPQNNAVTSTTVSDDVVQLITPVKLPHGNTEYEEVTTVTTKTITTTKRKIRCVTHLDGNDGVKRQLTMSPGTPGTPHRKSMYMSGAGNGSASKKPRRSMFFSNSTLAEKSVVLYDERDAEKHNVKNGGQVQLKLDDLSQAVANKVGDSPNSSFELDNQLIEKTVCLRANETLIYENNANVDKEIERIKKSKEDPLKSLSRLSVAKLIIKEVVKPQKWHILPFWLYISFISFIHSVHTIIIVKISMCRRR